VGTMNDNGVVCIGGCITAVVIAGLLTGHDGYLLLTGIGILGGLAGWQGKSTYIRFMGYRRKRLLIGRQRD